MKFNKNILNRNGIKGFKNYELINIVNYKINYLLTHNKNYTKQQYYELTDIAEIMMALQP